MGGKGEAMGRGAEGLIGRGNTIEQGLEGVLISKEDGYGVLHREESSSEINFKRR